jgi:IPT/TIG domain
MTIRQLISLIAFALTWVIAGCGGGSNSPAPGSPTGPSSPVTNAVPAITSLTPSSAIAGGGSVTITVTGTGFVSASVVQFNHTELSTIFASANMLTATLPASGLTNGSTAGVTVSNPAPGGGVSSVAPFTVNNPQPVVKSVNPVSIVAGSSAVTLEVTGSGFVPSSVVNWNGAPLATTLLSSTELQAALPAPNMAGSSANMVTVTNGSPGGGASGQTPLNVTSPLPVLSAISPKLVPTGAPATITLTGTGFEANSLVLWNGSPRPTVFVSAVALQVMLTAADLQSAATGSLTVNNPGPGGSTSGSAVLTVAQPSPTITGVSFQSVPYGGQPGGACSQLQILVTGTNFASNSIIKVNGIGLQNITYLGDLTTIAKFLPAGFQSKPGALSVTVTNPYPTGATSAPFVYPASNPPVLAICPSPSAPAVLPGSSFSVAVQPTEVNAPGGEQVTVGALPAGLTVSSPTVPLPPGGALLHFQAASSLAAGTDAIPLTGAAGSAVASANLTLTVNPSLIPSFSFVQTPSAELGVAIGGSNSIQYSTSVFPANADFDVTPSLSGLPPGTTATISPAVLSPGQTVTVTVTASANAPVTQNALITLTGTPSATVTPASTTFLLDVTQPPGSLPDNRTDFTSTSGQPYTAVYDPVHDLIFSSNPSWNRVDVLSNKTHQVIKSIPMLSPQGLDITQDSSTVWVGTFSQQVFAIDTAHLTATRYLLPKIQYLAWQDSQVEALADGTVLFLTAGGSVAVWDPASNTVNPLLVPSGSQPGLGWGPFRRSGDGTKAYSFNADSSNCQILVYDVAAKSVAPASPLSEVCGFYAANQDGSRLVVANNAGVGLYDSSLNLLGTIFPGNPAETGYFEGSFIFSRDGGTLYEISGSVISTIDVASLQVLGTAPDMSTEPFSVTSGGQFLSGPFAVDATGMMLGILNFGIAFEDTTFFQSYGTRPPPPSYIVSLSNYSGPLAGGTQVSPYGYFNLIPDVWFGNTRGTSVVSGNTLTVTTPPASLPGPVNMKYLFPDGSQYFSPLAFSYSAAPQFAVFSGAPPEGGVPATITGFGMPVDASGGSVTVGGNSATITSTRTQYLPFTGGPYPATNLNFTVPAGANGLADISVTTPAGTGTLPKALFYAKTVTDYPSADTFTSVLFDSARNQVYLTSGDHLDVFSTTANQFVSPLYPAAAGKVKQFVGLALTPDNTQLLVPDLQDGSLAVVNPDTPANTFAIAIVPEYSAVNDCQDGPLYVAASANHQAFVTTGSLPALSCGAGGLLYVADLQSRAVTQPIAPQCGFFALSPPFGDAASADASTDGNSVLVSSCLYSAQAGTYTSIPLGGAQSDIAGDANVLASTTLLADGAGNQLGHWATPLALYQNIYYTSTANIALLRPRLNASGSLYYIAYPNYVEILDVLHGRLLMRFSLNETIQDTGSPLAIDAGGRHVYLITDKGLTVIDLGEAPLAIGHLSQQTASVGTQVLVRGSGFDATVTATIGGQAAAVSVTDENTLTLAVPAAASGPEDILLRRADGTSYTLENGITLP